MAEEQESLQFANVLALSPGYPDASLPTIFADGVANLGPNAEFVRFYLFRTEPNFAGPDYKNQVVAQVIMPMKSFIPSLIGMLDGVKHLADRDPRIKELLQASENAPGFR